jgi:hypothetical protein
MGPAPTTDFHLKKITRPIHENMSNFSLGMISCWGIHHMDIAQWITSPHFSYNSIEDGWLSE